MRTRRNQIMLAVIVAVSAAASTGIMFGALPDGMAPTAGAFGVVVLMTVCLSVALLMIVAGFHNCVVSKDWRAPRTRRWL